MASRKPEAPRAADKRVTWLLTVLGGVGFGGGTLTINGSLKDLANEVRLTRDEMQKISLRLSVLESADVATRLRELERRAVDQESRIQDHGRRLDSQEKDRPK